MDAQEIAVGWWSPGAALPRAAFHGYARPAPEGCSSPQMEPPAARWEPGLGELLVDCDDLCNADDAQQTAMTPARSVVRHSCAACHWNPALAATVDGVPPPVR